MEKHLFKVIVVVTWKTLLLTVSEYFIAKVGFLNNHGICGTGWEPSSWIHCWAVQLAKFLFTLVQMAFAGEESYFYYISSITVVDLTGHDFQREVLCSRWLRYCVFNNDL